MKKPRILAAKLTVVLLSAAAMITGCSLLCPATAHAQGGVPLWTNRYEGPVNGDDGALAIAVDKSGNALVAGTSEGRFLIIKYSSAGALLWTNFSDGPVNFDDAATAIAVDDGGNAFVTGFSRDVGGYTDFRTIKYATTGDLLWINDGLVVDSLAVLPSLWTAVAMRT